MSVSIIRSKGLQDMSARTTAETPTMRERLARNAARRYFDDFDWSLLEYPDRETYADAYWPKFVAGVDEDLREMLEPSDDMKAILANYVNGLAGEMSPESAGEALAEVIQHILNESKD